MGGYFARDIIFQPPTPSSYGEDVPALYLENKTARSRIAAAHLRSASPPSFSHCPEDIL